MVAPLIISGPINSNCKAPVFSTVSRPLVLESLIEKSQLKSDDTKLIFETLGFDHPQFIIPKNAIMILRIVFRSSP